MTAVSRPAKIQTPRSETPDRPPNASPTRVGVLGGFGGARKAGPATVSRFKNLRKREAPVTVSIRFEVLEFDFSKDLAHIWPPKKGAARKKK